MRFIKSEACGAVVVLSIALACTETISSTGDGAGAGGAAGSAGSAGAGGSHGIACAGAALCWDFEEGAIPTGWVMLRPMDLNGELLVDDTRPHGGSGYSLHMKDLSGGTVGNAGGPKKSMQYWLPDNFGPVMWGRAFVYTTPEAPMSHAGLFNARFPQPHAAVTSMNWCNGAVPCVPMDWFEVASYQQNYMSIWHPPEPPGFPEWVKLSDTELVVDEWTCVEWFFDADNGAEPEAADPRVWLNGTELAWPTEFTFDDSGTDSPIRPATAKGLNFTMIETGVVMYQGLETVTNYWIDDLAIGTERIGCE
jgi:hypothetical protein